MNKIIQIMHGPHDKLYALTEDGEVIWWDHNDKSWNYLA